MEDKTKEIEEFIKLYISDKKLMNYEFFKKLDFFEYINERMYFLLRDVDIRLDEISDEKLSVIEKIELVKKYFKEIDYGIDLDRLISDGTVDLNFGSINKFTLGKNVYDKEHKVIEVSETGEVVNSIVLVHELSHYKNQPEIKRNIVNDMFTEAIAYCEELIYSDWLIDLGYKNSVKNFKRQLLLTIFNLNREYFPILKLFNLYREKGDISKISCDEYYGKTMEYKKYIEVFYDKIKNENISVYKICYMVNGFFYAIHMYQEYKKNPDYINIINGMHEKIQTGSSEECVSYMGVKRIDDVIVNFENFIAETLKDDKLEEKKQI